MAKSQSKQDVEVEQVSTDRRLGHEQMWAAYALGKLLSELEWYAEQASIGLCPRKGFDGIDAVLEDVKPLLIEVLPPLGADQVCRLVVECRKEWDDLLSSEWIHEFLSDNLDEASARESRDDTFDLALSQVRQPSRRLREAVLALLEDGRLVTALDLGETLDRFVRPRDRNGRAFGLTFGDKMMPGVGKAKKPSKQKTKCRTSPVQTRRLGGRRKPTITPPREVRACPLAEVDVESWYAQVRALCGELGIEPPACDLIADRGDTDSVQADVTRFDEAIHGAMTQLSESGDVTNGDASGSAQTCNSNPKRRKKKGHRGRPKCPKAAKRRQSILKRLQEQKCNSERITQKQIAAQFKCERSLVSKVKRAAEKAGEL